MTKPLPQNLSITDLAGVVILAGGLSTRMGAPKALLSLPSGETLLDYHLHSAGQLGVPVLIADNEQGYRCSVNNVNNVKNDDDADNSYVAHIEDYQPQSSNPHAEAKHSAGPLGAILAAMQQLLVEPSSNTPLNEARETTTDAATTDATTTDESTADVTRTDVAQSQWLIVVSCDSLISATDIWQQLQQWQSLQQSLQPSLQQGPAPSQTQQTSEPKAYCLTDDQSLYPLLGLYQLDVAERLKAYLDAGERRVMAFIKPICQQLPMPEAWGDLSNLNTPEQFHQACQSLQSL